MSPASVLDFSSDSDSDRGAAVPVVPVPVAPVPAVVQPPVVPWHRRPRRRPFPIIPNGPPNPARGQRPIVYRKREGGLIYICSPAKPKRDVAPRTPRHREPEPEVISESEHEEDSEPEEELEPEEEPEEESEPMEDSEPDEDD